MAPLAATLFDTAIGRCGIAWSERGIAGLQLPEPAGAARGRLLSRFPEAREESPPASVRQAIEAVAALLAGGDPDLDAVELDWTAVGPFERAVYETTRRIPRGETRSYGEIAAALGDPGAARAVGQALGRNPFPVIVPCHRVLAADGRPGGFSAPGGVATKLRMLAIEGAPGNAEFDFG
ncbi:MAG: methylated-DNA--[protein]-cysteine S-methyltransferase [Steroidobacteraceae bacterium]